MEITITIFLMSMFTFFAGRWKKRNEYGRHGRNTKGHYYDALFIAVLFAVIVWTIIMVIK